MTFIYTNKAFQKQVSTLHIPKAGVAVQTISRDISLALSISFFRSSLVLKKYVLLKKIIGHTNKVIKYYNLMICH